ARRVDEPAVAQVDPGVVDLALLRPRATGPEEEHVGRLELGDRNSLRPRNLAAHLVGRAALDRLGEVPFARIRLELVDAPDEARAIEPARCSDAERRLTSLARPAPDIGVTDEPHRRVEDPLLP